MSRRENLEQAKRNLEQTKQTWQERRGEYEKQLAIASDVSQQFNLRKKIKECQNEINRLNEEINKLNEEINSLNERQPIPPPPPREEPPDDDITPPPPPKWWVIGTAIAFYEDNLSPPKWWVVGTAIALLTLAGATGIIYVHQKINKNPRNFPAVSLGEQIVTIDILDASNSQEISLGEQILIKQDIPDEKVKEFEKAFADRDYQQFKYLLGDYLKQNPNSPELWVYWNNAKAALDSNKNPIKIAVSIPIGEKNPNIAGGKNPNIANEILRGVALAQNEFNYRNNETGINGRLLQVVIANDNNEDGLAKTVAQSFAQDPSILAVVGHNASNASLAAMGTYINNRLVMITPTGSSEQLKSDSYIFRMVPTAYSLGLYVKKEYPNSIIGICADPDTADNNSAFLTQFYVLFDKKAIDLSCDFLNDQGLTEDALDKEVTRILEEIK